MSRLSAPENTAMETPTRMRGRLLPLSNEWFGAVCVGLLALVISAARTMHEPAWPTDFDQWYHAARAMWQGLSPYNAVGPTRAFQWDWPLNYPLSTVLLAAPLAVFSLPVARVLFATLGGAVLGFAIGRDGFRRLGLVCSAAFLIAVSRNQWSPYYTAAFFVPSAVLFLVAKPNMAVAFVAAISNWRQLQRVIIVLVVVAGISMIVRPGWPREWQSALQEMSFIVAPIMRPGGWLCALALLKWRRPEARLFLALMCVPQTPSLYDLLPLFVVTTTVRQVSVLALLTHVLFLYIVMSGPFSSFNEYAYALGNTATFVVYLPVLFMILRRPNVAHDVAHDMVHDMAHDAADGVAISAAPSWPQGAGLSVRRRIENLPRLDAWLLLLNIAATVGLFWVSLATRRI